MSFLEILDSALFDTAQLYNSIYVIGGPVPLLVDRWITTSGNPCVFCRGMELMSIRVNVPQGGKFPIPQFDLFLFAVRRQLTSVSEPGQAHDHCQCERVTLPTR